MIQKEALVRKVLWAFVFSLVFATVGVVAGQWVPVSLFLPLALFELVILISALFFRKNKKIGYGFLCFFTFLTGVTTYPTLAHYTGAIGGRSVLVAFLTTTLIFIVLGVYGWKTKRNLSFLGGTLLSALFALILLSLIALFFPLGSVGAYVITWAGIIIFSGYIIYDFNQIKQSDVKEEDVPLIALNLYLDFLNLLLDILRAFKD